MLFRQCKGLHCGGWSLSPWVCRVCVLFYRPYVYIILTIYPIYILFQIMPKTNTVIKTITWCEWYDLIYVLATWMVTKIFRHVSTFLPLPDQVLWPNFPSDVFKSINSSVCPAYLMDTGRKVYTACLVDLKIIWEGRTTRCRHRRASKKPFLGQQR